MDYQISIHSLYICVKDMERAVRFYEEFLGQKADTHDPVFSVFSIGGFRYCLFQPDLMGETAVWGDNCLPSFETNNIESVRKKVIEMGRPIVFPLKQIGDNLVFEFTDSEGNDIEVYSPQAQEPLLLESGTTQCPCKRVKCPRHGKCTECMEHHSTKKRPPYCKRK